MNNGINLSRSSSLESTNAAKHADASSTNAAPDTTSEPQGHGSLPTDSVNTSDKQQPSLADAKANLQSSPSPTGDPTVNKTRLGELLPEHLSNPESIDLTTVRKQYTYKALADAQKSAAENQAVLKNKIGRLTISQKNLRKQFPAHFNEESDPSERANLTKAEREIIDRHDAVTAKLNSHVADHETLTKNHASLQTAMEKHSRMRTQVFGKYSNHFQSGIGVMNTAFLLLSIPSMFQMVRSFFPSSEKNEDQMPAPPPPPPSGAQSFQPRGIVNHQANLMRAQQQQMAQLPPSLQAAFLQGPVAAPGGMQYPQYAPYPQPPQVSAAA